jgi:hypothetical protein
MLKLLIMTKCCLVQISTIASVMWPILIQLNKTLIAEKFRFFTPLKGPFHRFWHFLTYSLNALYR